MSETRGSLDLAFLTKKGHTADEKLAYLQDHPEVRGELLKAISDDPALLDKLPKNVLCWMVMGTLTGASGEKADDEETDDEEVDSLDPVSDGEEDDLSIDESTVGGEDDNYFKRGVLFLQRFSSKQITCFVALVATIIWSVSTPYGVFSLLTGILPLLCGIFGDGSVRNANTPLKWLWFFTTMLTTQGAISFIFFLVLGILVLTQEKLEPPVLPRDKAERIIFRGTPLTRLGIPLPWRRFEIKRLGGKLIVTYISKLYGGDNAQPLVYCKDPEIVSTFLGVLFGGFQELILKDVKSDKVVLRVRLARTCVRSLVSTGFMNAICELAKSSDELGGGSRVLHS